MNGKPRAPHLKLIVSDEVITQSLSRDSSHCMIAEAVKAAFPDATHVSVDLQTIRLSHPAKGVRYTYLTPRAAQIGIIKFDQGMKPEAFDITLRNGQVTRMGNSSKQHYLAALEKDPALTEKRKKQTAKAKSLNPLRKATLVERQKNNGNVSERVGGQTPPMQKLKNTDIAFSKRRAFGLRGLDM